MPIVDIADLNEYSATRAANPTALIRMIYGDGSMTLFFPDGSGMSRYEVH